MDESLTINLHNRQQAWQAIKTQVFPFLAQVHNLLPMWSRENISKGKKILFLL